MPNKYFWAGASIVAIWLTVVFVGIYGPDFEFQSGSGNMTRVPVAWGMSLFATIATIAIALRGFHE